MKKNKTKVAKSSRAKAVKAKPAKKAPATKKAATVTATDQVLKIINRSKKGVNTATLMKKTGFDQKKAWVAPESMLKRPISSRDMVADCARWVCRVRRVYR